MARRAPWAIALAVASSTAAQAAIGVAEPVAHERPAAAQGPALMQAAQSSAPGEQDWEQGKRIYLSGNHVGAVPLIRQAAQAGYPIAVYEMGYLYENGDGVPRDMAQAGQWYAKGAQMGQPSAEAALGLMYEEGRAAPDDWVQAARWYMKSASQGNHTGEFRLGRAYQYGIGVPLDLNQAVGWYDKAAAQGDSQAAYFARYIRDNHGFDRSSYSAQEQAIMAPYMMQPWMLHPPPSGRVFRNTEDRLDYFRAWAHAAAEYNACMARHAHVAEGVSFSCPAPVPPR